MFIDQLLDGEWLITIGIHFIQILLQAIIDHHPQELLCVLVCFGQTAEILQTGFKIALFIIQHRLGKQHLALLIFVVLFVERKGAVLVFKIGVKVHQRITDAEVVAFTESQQFLGLIDRREALYSSINCYASSFSSTPSSNSS